MRDVHFPPGSFTAKEVGVVLRVSRNTVSMWCATGKIPATRDDNGRWLIAAAALNRYVESCRESQRQLGKGDSWSG
jgi:excisionase family DNA binding protein